MQLANQLLQPVLAGHRVVWRPKSEGHAFRREAQATAGCLSDNTAKAAQQTVAVEELEVLRIVGSSLQESDIIET